MQDCGGANQTWEYSNANHTLSLLVGGTPAGCLTELGRNAGLTVDTCRPADAEQQWTFANQVPVPPPALLNATIHASAPNLRFDGMGLLSAGASSRLLLDYPEAQRSQILDYLFKPNFGASLDIIKVEIGGDCQSTSGTEASHMHSRDDMGCGRGYEGWLLKEARKRNPSIRTWGLSWGVPNWVGNGKYFSAENIDYQTKWLRCINETTGIMVDSIGIWNERPWGPPWYTIELRKSLDASGFHNTGIVLPDGRIGDDLVNALRTNATFRNAVYAVGAHGCGQNIAGGLPKPYWCSESEVSNGWVPAKVRPDNTHRI